jgi:hypothetical protein
VLLGERRSAQGYVNVCNSYRTYLKLDGRVGIIETENKLQFRLIRPSIRFEEIVK